MSATDTPVSMLTSFLPRRNMRDEIIEKLRGAVITGELRPGVVYSAPGLAEQFGVSPTPVREAMIDLAKEGLFETLRNKGFRVREPSDQELDNLAEIRLLIEAPTVRKVAEAGIPGPILAELRALADGIEKAAIELDFITYISIDTEFHCRLLGLAGNNELVETVRSLRARSRLYGVRPLAEQGKLIPSAHEHVEVLDLIERGDAAGAEELIRRHIGHVRGIWAASGS
ncbi:MULTISPECIES: GntR family transcriptional regulator [unclassified Nocardia]|uniref:GntR family transcriptional regulator n=1 Tax=unclassified Nocardia TaxID=2637762 RepID=UPI001CE40780|nr:MULTISPECIES: GntR family transcriptional regulator [unclassified Nocardia]